MAVAVPVDTLRAGDHACLTYSDDEERRDIVAAFVADGLDLGQQVVCFIDGSAPDELRTQLAERDVPVTDALYTGQLRLDPVERTWMIDGGFRADAVLELITVHVDQSRGDGYTGLRMTADMSWAARPRAGVEQLSTFEDQVNALFAGGRLTSICQYDRQRFDPVTLAMVTDTHPRTVAAATYHDDAVLRICRQYRPRGIRIAGEIDHNAAGVLRTALAEAVRLDHHIHVNLAELRFMDATIGGEILNAAAALPGDRQMIVRCPGHIAKILTVLNPSPLAQMRVVVTDG